MGPRQSSASPDHASETDDPNEPSPDFEAIYEAWFDEVARWIRAMGAPESDREDLVQDVFLIVYRQLDRFKGGNLAGWLYQIARRRVRDFRRLVWIRHLFAGSVPVSANLTRGGPGPADEIETKQKAQEIEKLLGTLNPDQRAAFVLFEVEGWSGAAIARLQGVPLNTVWARIHKARKKLHAKIAKQD